MDLLPIVEAIQNTGFAEWMRMSRKGLPIINWMHVVAITTVFGTIFVVDLRLLNYPNASRSFTRLSEEMLRWTWGAFALAVITGLMLFAANAVTYYNNTAFWLKMGAIVLAGINMAVFQFLTFRSVTHWDRDRPTPVAARAAGAMSILLWLSVIFLGRWIGFTKGYNFEVPDEIEEDLFDFGMRLIEAVSGFG